MNKKTNSVPSVGTEVENSANVEVSSVNPTDAKPIVGCSASLSTEEFIFKRQENPYIYFDDLTEDELKEYLTPRKPSDYTQESLIEIEKCRAISDNKEMSKEEKIAYIKRNFSVKIRKMAFGVVVSVLPARQ